MCLSLAGHNFYHFKVFIIKVSTLFEFFYMLSPVMLAECMGFKPIPIGIKKKHL